MLKKSDYPIERQAEGYNIPAVESWIEQNISGLVPPFQWRRLEGGHSNLTYRLSDKHNKKVVVRRPPKGILLPKAHDMGREWAIISCLGPTGFPVPSAFGICHDTEITGAIFYVMGFSDGRALTTAQETSDWVPKNRRETLANSFIDTLADLHALDPDEIGLGSLSKKEDYIGRQVKSWYRSWTSSIEPANYDDPRAHKLKEYLVENAPAQGTARVVHGDYGFHNCLVGNESTISAVLDWEISTLGDPLADLAYTLKSWPETVEDITASPAAPTSAGGFPTRSSLAKRYSERTNLSVDKLDFYIGFNHWKSAAIVHGVYARYLEGKKSTKGIDLDELRTRINMSLNAAVLAIDRYKADSSS